MTAADRPAGHGTAHQQTAAELFHRSRADHDHRYAEQEIAAALAAADRQGYERGRRDFQFAPEGDNHHNATLCPYCSPEREAQEAAAEQRGRDDEKRRVLELADHYRDLCMWDEHGWRRTLHRSVSDRLRALADRSKAST